LKNWNIAAADGYYVGSFFCMASPCELLIDTNDSILANHITKLAANEAFRIEGKFSRYRSNNLVHAINQARGKPVEIDDETFSLLEFCDTCYQLSEGLFDISSGVLRKVWQFDGSNKIPSKRSVDDILPYVGWKEITFSKTQIQMPKGFEIDFGGMGKEYAVDCAAKLCAKLAPNISILVNFGGDIQVTRPRKEGCFWHAAIEMPTKNFNNDGKTKPTNFIDQKHSKAPYPVSYQEPSQAAVKIAQGGLATSGDANRYLLHNNVRYSHILNPKTGYPVKGGPRSITVASDHCIQAGLLATLALLQGKNAETYLKKQDITFWCYW
jgi:thiamine biosynthesis lipoprotein